MSGRVQAGCLVSWLGQNMSVSCIMSVSFMLTFPVSLLLFISKFLSLPSFSSPLPLSCCPQTHPCLTSEKILLPRITPQLNSFPFSQCTIPIMLFSHENVHHHNIYVYSSWLGKVYLSELNISLNLK